MQKTDHFFIKLVIVLVIAILALVSIVYFMENGWRMPDRVNWSFNKNTGEEMEVIDNESDQLGVEEDPEEVLLPNRRYIEMKKDVCDEGVEFTCEEYEFEFSDETGCGCELTEEYIEEMENRANEELNIEEEEAELGYDLEPGFCTREYMPVCALVDGEYRTFSNDCMAEAEGVYDYTEGECDINPELPVICTMEYAPVCGILDGEYKTFGNDCMAEGAGVFDYTEGECE